MSEENENQCVAHKPSSDLFFIFPIQPLVTPKPFAFVQTNQQHKRKIKFTYKLTKVPVRT